MEIVVAVLSGVFSLTGILLSHYLNVRATARLQQHLRNHSPNGTTEPPRPTTQDPVAEKPAMQDSSQGERPKPKPTIPPRSPKITGKPRVIASTGWRVPLLLWLSVFPYTMFAIVLVNSTGDDVKAGYMFVGNSVVVAVGCIVATAVYSKSHFVAFIAAIVQLGILAAMLMMGTGDKVIVVPLNLIIAASFLLIGTYYLRKMKN